MLTPGTTWAVRAGSRRSWCSFATVVALAESPVGVTKVSLDGVFVCWSGAWVVVHVAVAPESAMPEGMAPVSVARRSSAISIASINVAASLSRRCFAACRLAFLRSHFVELSTCSRGGAGVKLVSWVSC